MNDLAPFLRSLRYQRLESIKAGAHVTITDVDTDAGRVSLTTAAGTSKSRPLAELQRVWSALQTRPAVHVDSLLAGSGSSRNQPETILANNPRVEWLRIDNKKHLVLRPDETHASGTLREMDPVEAQELRNAIKEGRRGSAAAFLLVTQQLQPTITMLTELGAAVKSLRPGQYSGVLNDVTWWISSSDAAGGVGCGTYPVLPASAAEGEPVATFVLGSAELALYSRAGQIYALPTTASA
jgi:hypothetical protein